MGYPFVPGSSLKGALKTFLSRSAEGSERGNSNIVRCLLGGEVGEGGEGASAVSFGPATLIAVPAPSPGLGVVYVTTPYLLSRASTAMEPWLPREAEALAKVARGASGLGMGEALALRDLGAEVVVAGPQRLRIKRIEESGSEEKVFLKNVVETIKRIAKGLNPLYDAHLVEERLLVVEESSGKSLVEKLLLRLTRVRLSRETKTVERGALWTEEYIPPGTLMISPIFDTGFRNSFCVKAGLESKNAVEELLNLLRTVAGEGADYFYLIVGGKESVGAGLVKTKVLSPQGGGGTSGS